MPLANRKPSDRVAIEAFRNQRLRRKTPQLRIDAALHDRKQILRLTRAERRLR